MLENKVTKVLPVAEDRRGLCEGSTITVSRSHEKVVFKTGKIRGEENIKKLQQQLWQKRTSPGIAEELGREGIARFGNWFNVQNKEELARALHYPSNK
jgi:hypothetical protein